MDGRNNFSKNQSVAESFRRSQLHRVKKRNTKPGVTESPLSPVYSVYSINFKPKVSVWVGGLRKWEIQWQLGLKISASV